jgi:hypothetical protein
MNAETFIQMHHSATGTREYVGLGPRIPVMGYSDALDCLTEDAGRGGRMRQIACQVIADCNGVNLCTGDGACADDDDFDDVQPDVLTEPLEWALSEARRGNHSEALIRLADAFEGYPDAVEALDLIRRKLT